MRTQPLDVQASSSAGDHPVGGNVTRTRVGFGAPGSCPIPEKSLLCDLGEVTSTSGPQPPHVYDGSVR